MAGLDWLVGGVCVDGCREAFRFLCSFSSRLDLNKACNMCDTGCGSWDVEIDANIMAYNYVITFG